MRTSLIRRLAACLAGAWLALAPAGAAADDHLPVVEQREAVGHAVRAAYMYAAMVDVAAIQHEPAYRGAVARIWEDVVFRKLYLTGGLGAPRRGRDGRLAAAPDRRRRWRPLTSETQLEPDGEV